jgi:hypothetical protein
MQKVVTSYKTMIIMNLQNYDDVDGKCQKEADPDILLEPVLSHIQSKMRMGRLDGILPLEILTMNDQAPEVEKSGGAEFSIEDGLPVNYFHSPVS